MLRFIDTFSRTSVSHKLLEHRHAPKVYVRVHIRQKSAKNRTKLYLTSLLLYDKMFLSLNEITSCRFDALLTRTLPNFLVSKRFVEYH